MAKSRFTLTLERGWEGRVFRSSGTRSLVARHTSKLAASAIKEAPRRSATKRSWNAIKRNISAVVAEDLQGWYGNVLLEDDERVRHTLLQERGWRDPKGRRHPGRRFLKRALEKARIE